MSTTFLNTVVHIEYDDPYCIIIFNRFVNLIFNMRIHAHEGFLKSVNKNLRFSFLKPVIVVSVSSTYIFNPVPEYPGGNQIRETRSGRVRPESGGVVPPTILTTCVFKKPLFLQFFSGRSRVFFCRGDRKILITEMDVINSGGHRHVFIFF